MSPASEDSITRSPEYLQERLISFAVELWNHVQDRSGDPSMSRICDQVVRAATSTAANYAEARAAESRRDFIHKMQICLKELRETGVWLEILGRFNAPDRIRALAQENDELSRIFVSSIRTARNL